MAASFDFTPAAEARRMAFVALFALALMCLLSQLSFKTSNWVIPFSFVPTAVICLWPKYAHSLLSLIGIFALGLFQDAMGAGPNGVWALLWTALFLIMRPDLQNRSQDFLLKWGAFLIVIAGIGLGHILIGRFILQQVTALDTIVISVVIAFLSFPLVWVFREFTAQSLGSREA